jgi:hypothetical protein
MNDAKTTVIAGLMVQSFGWIACLMLCISLGCAGNAPPASSPEAAARRDRESKKAEQVIAYRQVQGKDPSTTQRKFAAPFFVADVSSVLQGEWIRSPVENTTEALAEAQTVVLFSARRTKVEEPLRFGAPDQLPLGNEDGYQVSVEIDLYDVRNPRRSRRIVVLVEPARLHPRLGV